MLRERRRHANFKPNRKLDRKSSRGMIYENEELRLRTININAEVERGQSDIKKLLRENYRLRSENWTLRDEYDRLDKLFKNKNRPNGGNSTNSHDFHGLSSDDCKLGCECCSYLGDDDNVSCDMCNEDCMKEVDNRPLNSSMNGDKENSLNGSTGQLKSKTSPATMSASQPVRNDKIDMNFDHLSVVSEECLSGSEDPASPKPTTNTESEKIDLDPIYSNFQSTVPPLKHFENLSYKDIGPNIGSSGEIRFDENELTPPPPSPPPSSHNANRRSTSLPLPPPPSLNADGDIINEDIGSLVSPMQQKGDSPETALKKTPPKYFFAPLKSKRKSSLSTEMLRPDVLLVNNNIVPSDGNRLATIRKPHNPLKYPSNLNAASVDPQTTSQTDDIQGLSKGIESMQMHPNRIYENVSTAKQQTTDDEQSPPYRTEMSLILSYAGNKSKYSTNQNTSKSSESGTPPPNVPQAMKLFPNKLTYTANTSVNSTFKQMPANSQDVEQSIVNTENSANEEILSKSQVNTQSLERINDNGAIQSVGKNSDARSSGSNRDTISSNDDKESSSKSKSRHSNGSQGSKESQNGTSKPNGTYDNEKETNSRRVSIHCNGIPMNDQLDNEPHSNDSDLNNATELSEEELLAITPISCLRSRRSSSSRKLSDEIGSFLYPPNPFALGNSYKRGRRSSFFGRRHSDGLVPPRHNQYIDYGLSTPKASGRCHCHRNHGHCTHHLGSNGYSGDGHNAGGSTTSSIGNNMASSRESLGNLSQQSNRRKMSITSHSKSAGKIPWCACWGNGCL